MRLRKPAAYILVAAAALLFGFVVAVQVRAGLLTPSNQVARAQALVRSVQDLERTNRQDRDRISELRSEVSQLEAEAAARSAANRTLTDRLAELRQRAGLTPLRGPGVKVTLADGQPGGPDLADHLGYRISFEDIQDLVNLLFAGGAEGIAVNGRRLTPLSGFRSDGVDVLIDQGPPLDSPFTISAIGDPTSLQDALQESGSLPDIHLRVGRFQVRFDWTSVPDMLLPPYDSSLVLTYARPS